MTCTEVVDGTIHQGALAPYAFQYVATSDSAAFDLSTATSAIFRVQRSNGSVDTWSATLSSLSASSATLTHTFVLGDVPDVDTLRITPEISTPAGTFFAPTKLLRVAPASEL